MTTFVGIEVYEYFSWPILIFDSPGLSSVGLRPSYLTTSFDPLKYDMMVLLPTPVSPIMMTASWF